MVKSCFIILFLIFFSDISYSTVPVKNAYTGVPVSVCTPSDSNSNCGSGGGGGSNYWTLSPGNVGINTTNNVGIGTISPTNNLQVVGGISIGSGTATITGDSNGNIGVGSATPGTKLDVAGSVRGTNIVDSGVTSSMLWANGSNQLAPVTLTTTGSSGASTFSAGTLNIPQYSGGGGGGYWVQAGGNQGIGTTANVGIGTTVPSSLLDIENTGTAVFNNLASVAFNGVTQVTTSGINVGIGTGSPTQALDVTGGKIVQGSNHTAVQPPLTFTVCSSTSHAGSACDFTATGTNDQVKINSAITACGSNPCRIVLMDGVFNISDSIGYDPVFSTGVPLINNLEIAGQGIGLTSIKNSNFGQGSIEDVTHFSLGSPIVNFTLHDLEIDRSADNKDGSITSKAVYIKYMKNVKIYNVYAHDADATCIGIDYLNGAFIHDNIISGCGTTGQTTGNSGIGIGTAQYANEPDIITGNLVTGSNYAGILLEAQNVGTTYLSSNFVVSNNIISGGYLGIKIRSVQNVTMNGNVITANSSDGINIETHNISNPPQDLVISGNSINNNSGYGINIPSTGALRIVLGDNDLYGNTSGTVNSSLSDPTQLIRLENFTDTSSYIPANVGVGSVNPGQALDVTGTIRASSNILIGSQSVCQANGTNCPSTSAAAAGGTNAVQYNSGSSTLAGKEQVFSMNGTNIGIGTTNGTSLLDVRGNSYFSGNIGIGTTQNTTIPLSVNGNVGIGTWTAANNMDVKGNMVIGSYAGVSANAAPSNGLNVSGNVSVGTFTSSRALTVFGTGTSAGMALKDSTGHEYDNLSIGSGSGFAQNSWVLYDQTSGVGRLYVDPNSNVGVNVGATQPVNSLEVAIYSAGAGNLSVGYGPGAHSAPLSGAIFSGNVGIGTWVPGQLLDVQGNINIKNGDGITLDGGSNQNIANVGGDLRIRSLTGGNGIDFASNIATGGASNSWWYIPTGGSTGYFLPGLDNTYGIGNSTNRPISITVGTASSSFAGNVGIGTTTPVGGLTVMNGNVGIGTWAPTSEIQVKGTCGAIGPVGTCWTSTGQLGYCSGVANACTSCTAC